MEYDQIAKKVYEGVKSGAKYVLIGAALALSGCGNVNDARESPTAQLRARANDAFKNLDSLIRDVE